MKRNAWDNFMVPRKISNIRSNWTMKYWTKTREACQWVELPQPNLSSAQILQSNNQQSLQTRLSVTRIYLESRSWIRWDPKTMIQTSKARKRRKLFSKLKLLKMFQDLLRRRWKTTSGTFLTKVQLTDRRRLAQNHHQMRILRPLNRCNHLQ